MKTDPTSEAEDDRERLKRLLAAALMWQAFRVAQKIADGATAEEIAEAAFDLSQEQAGFVAIIAPYLSAAAGRAISAMRHDYGLGWDASVEADFIREILEAQGNRFASDLTATSVRNIREQLAEGIAAGESQYQLRERILAYYERNALYRAGLAAQTETGRAYEAIRLSLAMQEGMTHKAWQTMNDGRVCSICTANQAIGWIPLEQPFPSGDMQPLSHPNCRCFCQYSSQ